MIEGETVPCCDKAIATSDVTFARGVAPFTTKMSGFFRVSIISTDAPTARRS